VKAGDRIVVLEAMKMEVLVTAPCAGELIELRCVAGAMVQPGQVLAVVR
jgi:urea carboxylase